jgi:hypothetical protein
LTVRLDLGQLDAAVCADVVSGPLNARSSCLV